MSSVAQSAPLKILVLDDHAAILAGIVSILRDTYGDATIQTAQTSQSALATLESYQPNLLLTDLAIPGAAGITAQAETGIQFLKTVMQRYPRLNIVVQSAHIRSLVRLQSDIAGHEAGFTIVDKSAPIRDLLTKVDWSLQGLIYTPREMRSRLEVKPEWLQVLELAFREGLQDKAIADRMNVSERSVRHYWNKIQNVLDVYPDDGKNIRIQTELRAREEGLLD